MLLRTRAYGKARVRPVFWLASPSSNMIYGYSSPFLLIGSAGAIPHSFTIPSQAVTWFGQHELVEAREAQKLAGCIWGQMMLIRWERKWEWDRELEKGNLDSWGSWSRGRAPQCWHGRLRWGTIMAMILFKLWLSHPSRWHHVSLPNGTTFLSLLVIFMGIADNAVFGGREAEAHPQQDWAEA